MEVQKFFEVKGPRGTYSHACTSLALQSFSKTTPKIWLSASLISIGSPKLFDFPPKKKPTSSSKSRHSVGSWVEPLLGSALSIWICPLGLQIDDRKVKLSKQKTIISYDIIKCFMGACELVCSILRRCSIGRGIPQGDAPSWAAGRCLFP